MAAPTLLAMRNNVRLLIQDTNTTTSPAFTDAQLTTFVNYGLMWWYENNEKRIKYATLVAVFTIGATEKDGDATCIYPEILEVSLVDVNSIDSPLEEMSWGEMRFRQASDTVKGIPTHYAKLKYGGSGVGAAAQNLWKFALYPAPAAAPVIKGVVRDYPVALSADADIVDLGDFEAKCVEIIAAILAAPRMGRPELAQDLMGLLSKTVQDKLQTRSHDEMIA
jgi:hypothetical protein